MTTFIRAAIDAVVDREKLYLKQIARRGGISVPGMQVIMRGDSSPDIYSISRIAEGCRLPFLFMAQLMVYDLHKREAERAGITHEIVKRMTVELLEGKPVAMVLQGTRLIEMAWIEPQKEAA